MRPDPDDGMRVAGRQRGHQLDRHWFATHRGHRILRVDFTGLSPEEHTRALDPVQDFITRQPPSSLLLMNLSNDRFTAASADAIKRYASSIDPYLRATAIVCPPGFRRAFVAVLNTQLQHEIRCFEDELGAMDWLITQAAEPGDSNAP